MSDVILGNVCKKNFGIIQKYSSDLNSVYKSYIDSLEQLMISVAYGNNVDNCLIVQSLDLVLTQDQIDNWPGEIVYKELENALVSFCRLHSVAIDIARYPTSITVTINMLQNFIVTNSR